MPSAFFLLAGVLLLSAIYCLPPLRRRCRRFAADATPLLAAPMPLLLADAADYC